MEQQVDPIAVIARLKLQIAELSMQVAMLQVANDHLVEQNSGLQQLRVLTGNGKAELVEVGAGPTETG